jgi:hypothetical protein
VTGGEIQQAGKAFKHSYASITWIRFHGSFAFRAKLSAFVVPADGRLAPRTKGKLGRFARSVKPVKVRFQKLTKPKLAKPNWVAVFSRCSVKTMTD